MRNDILFGLDQQSVRWYNRMFEFECDFAWYTMHRDTIIAITHSRDIQIHDNDNEK